MAVSLHDIAKAAKVDVSTVSRALSNAYGIRRATREKVLAIANRVGYRPNRLAQGLATGRSRTLGLVISDIRNPFFAELARGAEDAAFAAGYDLVLCNSDLDPAKQTQYVHSLQEKRVAGILMNTVAGMTRGLQQELAKWDVPVVLFNRPPTGSNFSTVTADNFRGGFVAGNYLIRLGHRSIALLCGRPQHGNLTERAKGFMKAVHPARKGVVAVVLRGPHTYQGGHEAAKKILESHRKVTAIFAANDAMAFGVIHAIHQKGLSVPEDLSVLGFDNVELSEIIRPPLTTIHQPKYEMGQAAVEILLKLGKQRDTHMPENRVFGIKLVERQSCRAL